VTVDGMKAQSQRWGPATKARSMVHSPMHALMTVYGLCATRPCRHLCGV